MAFDVKKQTITNERYMNFRKYFRDNRYIVIKHFVNECNVIKWSTFCRCIRTEHDCDWIWIRNRQTNSLCNVNLKNWIERWTVYESRVQLNSSQLYYCIRKQNNTELKYRLGLKIQYIPTYLNYSEHFVIRIIFMNTRVHPQLTKSPNEYVKWTYIFIVILLFTTYTLTNIERICCACDVWLNLSILAEYY